MFRRALQYFFGSHSDPAVVEVAHHAQPPRPFQIIQAGSPAAALPQYPPVDQGLPLPGRRDLISPHDKLVARLKTASSAGDDEWTALYAPCIDALADFVGLLPATRAANHRGAGGLLRLSLEVGFAAIQASDGFILAKRAPTEQRASFEARWRFAAFVAGLSCELYHCISDMVVADEAGNVWQPTRESLATWAETNKATRVYVRWNEPVGVDTPGKRVDRDRESRRLVPLLISRILSDDGSAYIAAPGTSILEAMFAAATGIFMTSETQPLVQLVDDARLRVIQRDAKLSPELYGALTIGAHLEPYILDAARELHSSGKWKCNAPLARLWALNDGLYLIWTPGAQELLDALRKRVSVGVPTETTTLLQMMVRAGLIVGSSDNPFCELTPPGAERSYAAVRLGSVDLIYDSGEVPPPDVGARVIHPSMGQFSLTPLVAGAKGAAAQASATGSGEPATGKAQRSTKSRATPRPAARDVPPPVEQRDDQSSEPTTASAGQESHQQTELPLAEPTALAQTQDPIAAVTEKAEKLLESLPSHSKFLLRAVIEDQRHLTKRGLVGEVPEGFAISSQCLKDQQVKDVQGLGNELLSAGVLFAPAPAAGITKPTRFIEVSLPNGRVTALILKHTVAIELGLIADVTA